MILKSIVAVSESSIGAFAEPIFSKTAKARACGGVADGTFSFFCKKKRKSVV
ncbi:MAG: hypothetical protein JSR33_01740 [Proteobacteria bacterium]|nr:hypothetical protein [Pseudomonadota bacterium]